MKKIVFCVVVCLVPLVLVGCGTSIKTDVVNNMSDIRYDIFVGQSEGVVVNLMTGLRENPYAYDGNSNKKTEFGVITVSFEHQPTQNVHFALSIDGVTTSGVLEENPYNHTFMADIEKIVSNDSGVFLTLEGTVQNLQLIPISKTWAVQYSQALDIAVNALQEDINEAYKNKKFQAECYLKIVLDQTNVDKPYYWCFMIVYAEGGSKSIVFDVNTGQILTQNNA